MNVGKGIGSLIFIFSSVFIAFYSGTNATNVADMDISNAIANIVQEAGVTQDQTPDITKNLGL